MSNIDIGGEQLSEEDNVVNYMWDIDNKYYVAQVLICATESITCKLPVEEVNALIFYHDPQAVRQH